MKKFLFVVAVISVFGFISCSMDVADDVQYDTTEFVSPTTQTTFIGVGDTSTVSGADPDCAEVGE